MMDANTPEFRMVKYRKHGILTKSIKFRTHEEYWTFKTSDLSRDISGGDLNLITILDDLSTEGFELVTSNDGEYILRTKEEIEHEQEYYSFDDESMDGG